MNRDKHIIKVSIYWIITNLILVWFKAIVWFLSNSIAIILDAVNNLSDALSSIITIIWTKLSTKKPDKKHPYWYWRIEYFSSVIIAVIVLLAWLTSFKESFEKILHPEAADYSIVSLIIIIVAVFVKFFFWRWVKKQWETLNSWSLIASWTDAISDSYLSFSTFIWAIISYFWWISLEGYLWVAISIFILKAAWEILSETINDMIWVRADWELTQKLKNRIMETKCVQWVYDLILHNYWPNMIIATAHIQVDDWMTAKEIDKVTRNLQLAIYEEFRIILTIWIYAANDTWEYKEIKNKLNELVKKHKSILQVHWFYVDDDTNNITFDVIFDFDEKKPEEIVEEIKESLKKQYPKYNINAIIDTDFSD